VCVCVVCGLCPRERQKNTTLQNTDWRVHQPKPRIHVSCARPARGQAEGAHGAVVEGGAAHHRDHPSTVLSVKSESDERLVNPFLMLVPAPLQLFLCVSHNLH
jgi:hypothetical protein